ncbi:MAG: hypothetical protein ABI401_10195 [Candidatus Dormibacter sp.]
MNAATPRRFPPAPGAMGWVGAAFVVAALVCQLVAGILLMLLIVNRDGGIVLPMVASFLLGFLLLAIAWLIWRTALQRAGSPPQSTVPREQRRELLIALAVMNAAAIVGIGGFIYLALHLTGVRRFAIALVPLTLAEIGSHYGVLKLRKIRGRPSPGILGWKPRHELAVVSVAALAISAFLLISGLFWIPN